jgi:hypothetical protein
VIDPRKILTSSIPGTIFTGHTDLCSSSLALPFSKRYQGLFQLTLRSLRHLDEVADRFEEVVCVRRSSVEIVANVEKSEKCQVWEATSADCLVRVRTQTLPVGFGLHFGASFLNWNFTLLS